MKEITTKTLINFLPLHADAKLELLEKYDSLPEDVQLQISDLAWEAFRDEYDFQVKFSFDELIAEAEKNGTQPAKDTYGQALQRARENVDARLNSAGDSTDLTEARKSMEQIARELNALKVTKKVNAQNPAPKL